MKRCRFAMDPTSWDTTTATETNSVRERPKNAVEKAGDWKPAKTKSRFPPAPTLPWKSRKNSEIPTFPQHPPPLIFSNQRTGGSRRLKPKPDRSRVNQTGHLALLTTQ